MAFLTPPGFEHITFKNKLKTANPNIPFADPPYGMMAEGSQTAYNVYFKTNEVTTEQEAAQNMGLKNQAADAFVMHYFPEYYPFMVDRSLITDEEWSSVEVYNGNFVDLRGLILNSIELKSFSKKPNPSKNKVVYATTVDLYGIRDSLVDQFDDDGNPLLPDPEIFLSVLNRELNRGAIDSTVAVKFQNIPSQSDQISNVMSGFGTLMNQLQQQQGPAGLNSLQTGVTRIIKKITDSIHDSIDFRSQRQSLHDTDYFIVYFDNDTEIVGISYFVAAVTAGEKEQSTVGYITNIKYNPIFNDEVPLALLKNYEFILEQAQADPTNLNDTDVLAFFERLAIPGDSSGWGQPLPWGQEPVEANDYGNLLKQLEEARGENPKDAEKIKKLEEMINDPVFQAKMIQAQEARVINTTVQVLDVMDDVLNMDVFNFMNATPEGRKANQVLQSFGITDLVTEAILCITRGLGESLSAVTQAVRDSIVDSTVSLNAPPTLPSQQPQITRPSFKDLKPEIYFSVTGDPPLAQRIEEMLLATITQAGFEIIKGLAELFKFNCADILESNQGEIDCGAELERRNNQAALDIPDFDGIIGQVANSKGLTTEEAYQYLSDVSQILNPIEVCQLLNSPNNITNDTITNILDFNSEYANIQVRTNLATGTSVVSFFRSMSAGIDTVSFCNEVIQDTLVTAIEGCRICPPEDFASPQIEVLANIAENGFQPTIPKPDFLCPESENYLANPVSERIIPQLFNSVMENVQIYMAGSLESARTAILEPVVVSTVDPNLLSAFEDCGVPAGDLPGGADPPNTAALDMMMNVFTVMDDVAGNLSQFTNHPACPDVKDEKFQAVAQNIEIISAAIRAALEEVPGLIDDVKSKLEQASVNVQGPNPHTEYVFSQRYKQDFVNAIALPRDMDDGIGPLVNVDFGAHGTLYGGSTYYYSFGAGSNYAEIKYDDIDSEPMGEIKLEYQMARAGIDLTDTNNLASPYLGIGDVPTGWADLNLNPYLYRFAAPMLAQGAPQDIEYITSEDHPIAYNTLMQRMFGYILQNGAFATEIINNLQLFKNNKNCTPANIGDLLDADGIIDQMRKEFAAAACFDQGSNQDKVRNTLYFGLINMLIQACIDEVIISNIVIFSAFNMEDILSPKYPFKELIIARVVGAVEKTISDGNFVVEREIFNYFQRASQRPSTAAAGGFTHSYAPNDVVPGFEGGSFPGNNSELVRFLVEERFGYVWADGDVPRSTIQAIANIIDPGSTKKLFEDFFLEDLVGVEMVSNWGKPSVNAAAITQLWENRAEEAIFEAEDPTAWSADMNQAARTLFFVSPAPGATDGDGREDVDQDYIMLYYRYRDSNAGGNKHYEMFRIEKPAANASYDEIVAHIKQSPEYNLFFSQAFNRDSFLMVPILYNFYKVEEQLSDVPAAFNSTKRAIIQMFEFTQASTQQPVLGPRNESFVEAMAQPAGPDLDSMARDIFLKFLRETPLQILKGLVELVDPHVAISKIIRDLTGAALNEVIKGVQAGLDKAEAPGLAQLKEDGVTAEDIFSVIFCLYNISQSVASAPFLPESLPGSDNVLFGPRFSVEGIDLTGTIAGMLMIPPSPLGIIYLLIELLKIKIDDDIAEGDDAVTTGGTGGQQEADCPEGTEPL